MAINLENERREIERIIRDHLVPWLSETFSMRDCCLKNVAFMTMEVQTEIPCNHEKTAAEQVRFLKADLKRLMMIRGKNVEVDAWIAKKGKVRIQFQEENNIFMHKWRVIEKEENESGLRCKLEEQKEPNEFLKKWPNITDEWSQHCTLDANKGLFTVWKPEKKEEPKMANLMDMVKLVEKDELIMLAVDGEEKEGTPETMTPQMLAKHSCKQVHKIQNWESNILLRVKE